MLIASGQFRLRAARIVALGCAIGISACTEPNAPEKAVTEPPPITTPGPTTALDSLGLWIGDATQWVLPSIEDETLRATVQSNIADLGSHLSARQYVLTRKDIGNLRALMDSLSTDLLHALGPIEVALKVIEPALDEAGM